jgi:hypothetical protein
MPTPSAPPTPKDRSGRRKSEPSGEHVTAGAAYREAMRPGCPRSRESSKESPHIGAGELRVLGTAHLPDRGLEQHREPTMARARRITRSLASEVVSARTTWPGPPEHMASAFRAEARGVLAASQELKFAIAGAQPTP